MCRGRWILDSACDRATAQRYGTSARDVPRAARTAESAVAERSRVQGNIRLSVGWNWKHYVQGLWHSRVRVSACGAVCMRCVADELYLRYNTTRRRPAAAPVFSRPDAPEC